MTLDQLENVRKLCKKYKITFNSRRSSDEWPNAHALLFDDVRKLGDTKYSIYAKSKITSSSDEPWGAQAIDRADRVTAIAERCRRERQNEAGWRYALEHEIFSRFTVEVACRNCRARLWRSEIEVSIESNSSEGSSLEQRRKSRIPCQCPSRSRQHDLNDTGLNPLFSYRAQECVEHEESVRRALGRLEHPDRVYGLVQTKTFERALCSPSSKGTHAGSGSMLVNEAIRITSFKQVGEPLLFPFLILEAKSAKGEDFDSIQKQTAFSIRTLLKIQADLRSECGQRVNSQGGPLVWFLYHRGEDWRVAACFIDDTNGQASYCIFDLWTGVLSSKDGALQLLLIIDHIFDWARDIYRPTVLRHLKSLSSNGASNGSSDTMSMDNDSDVFSLHHSIGTWMKRTQSIAPSNAGDTSDFEAIFDIVRPLRNLDSAEGVFRHVSFVDSEFLGIHITRDNANTLLLLADTPQQAVAFARKLLKALLNSRSMLLTEETLIELEDIWTGGASHFGNPVGTTTEFVVRLLLTQSLSNDWNQVRELSYLAASQEGLDVLVNRSGLRRPSQATASACDQQSVKAIVRRQLSIPAVRGLRAAIAREALSLEMTVLLHDGTTSEQLVAFKWEKDQTYGLIRKVYRKHKVGMREPHESFIRRSTRIDEQPLVHAPPSSSTLQTLDESDPLDQNRNGPPQFVLVSGKCVQVLCGSASSAPELCYYKISGPPEAPKALDLRMALQQILRTNYRIYVTETYARNSLSTKWNLNSFYDIYGPVTDYQRGKIDSWIAHLNRAGDRFDNLPSPPPSNSTTSSPSSAGAHTGKRRISLVEGEREAQHTKARNQSNCTPTRRGNDSAIKKIQRGAMIIDLTEDDGPEVQAYLQDIRKRVCVRPEESVRRGDPSRSTHSGESYVASSSVMPQVQDQVEPGAKAYRKLDRWLLEDKAARRSGGYSIRRSDILGNDQGKNRALDAEIHHDNRDGKAHSESSVSPIEPSGLDKGDRGKLGPQPEHDFGTHRKDKHLSAETVDVLVEAMCAEHDKELSRAKKRIRTSVSTDSRPDCNTGEVVEHNPVQLDRPPPTPIFREFTDKNGRWTYSTRDGGRFVRIT